MRLTGLDITGFKSFAKHSSLKFQSGNTAIVGPNGSGKSNIADAIRWVLGEQSMKTLRGKKLEDVIYAGGTSKGRLGMAEVSLTLENEGDDSLILDAPEIVITRRLYRSGESAYLVNNRPVRLLDVAEILAKAGFAQKTYTVIGQGMADSFVNATPQERRGMFEDATGVTPLLIKKEQTERKLEQTKENLTRAKDHLAELEPRLRSLKRQATRARQREEVEKELRGHEEVWFAHLWLSYNKTLQEADDKLFVLKDKINKINEQIKKFQPQDGAEDVTARLPELRAGLEKLRQEEQDFIIKLAQQGYMSEDIVDRKAEEKVAKEKEQQRLNGLLDEAMENIKQQESLLHNVREALRNAQDTLLSINKTSGSFDATKIKKEIKEVIVLQEALIERLNSVENMEELNALQEDAEKVRMLLQSLDSALDTNNEGVNLNHAELQQQLRLLTSQRDQLEMKITEGRINLAKLETNLRSVDERLLELNNERGMKNEGADNASLRNRLEEVRAQRLEIAKEVEKLEKMLFASHIERQKQLTELEEVRQQQHLAEQERYGIEVNVAGTRARKEDLEREIGERLNGDFLERLKSGQLINPEEQQLSNVEQTIQGLRKKIEQIGGIDPNVITEETEVETRVNELTLQLDDLDKASADLKSGIKELDKHIHSQFTGAMKNINETFNTYFRQVFGGGRASLSVVHPQPIVHEVVEEGGIVGDSLLSTREGEGGFSESVVEEHTHELPAGVEIKANPPGKKLGSVAQLSGGEKALTSVALLFAIISQRNSPFIVLDEVDAALDEANSRRFARMLKELSNKTQFLVITHNRATMESASALYGVTMQEDGISQLLSVKLSEVPEEFVGKN